MSIILILHAIIGGVIFESTGHQTLFYKYTKL